MTIEKGINVTPNSISHLTRSEIKCWLSATQKRRLAAAFVTLLLVTGGILLTISNCLHSPTLDEVAHLPAGCRIWETGRFDSYKVNPPLVKAIAAFPVWLLNATYDWSHHSDVAGVRREWRVGRDFIDANGSDSFFLFACARCALIPIWCLGGYLIFRWSASLFGRWSGFAALILWCFSPNVMTWAGSICPDAAAATLGVAAVYTFRRWLKMPSFFNVMLAGIALGIALLTKSTWIILCVLYVPLTFVYDRGFVSIQARSSQLVIIICLAVYTLNAGYGFEQTGRKLGRFPFFSIALAGATDDGRPRERVEWNAGNRFSKSWLGSLPVPLPSSYLEGIDLQKWEFEAGKWCYLGGEWKHTGWWYWYFYALAVKLPTGILSLLFLNFGLRIRPVIRAIARSRAHTAVPGPDPSIDAHARSKLAEYILLVAPCAVVFVLVSSQTGITKHVRYLLPCFPFAFILISQVFSPQHAPAWLRRAAWLCVGWVVATSMWVYPHSMAYFNELGGGPANGSKHLLGSNIDWGQDALLLKKWLDLHPEIGQIPLYLALNCHFDPAVAGIAYEDAPLDPRSVEPNTIPAAHIGARPGWYAISLQELHGQSGRYQYLQNYSPVDRIGYSIYIFHLTKEDARESRAKLWHLADKSRPQFHSVGR